MNRSETSRERLLPALVAAALIGLCYYGSTRLAGNRLVAVSSSGQPTTAPLAGPRLDPGSLPPSDGALAETAAVDGPTPDQRRTTTRYSDGQPRAEGMLQDDLPHGPWTFWNRAGAVVSQQVFRHGRLDGPYAVNYPDGRPALRGAMRDGRRHGEWTYYRESGAPWRCGNFSNGLPVGSWHDYDEQGQVIATTRIETLVGASH